MTIASDIVEENRYLPSLLLFVTTIFLSAFLLFQVQPLIAKHILPWFGGSPGVWTVCMLFFQILLLAGYAYAHYLDSYLSYRRQVLVHLTVLVLALLWLPIIPEGSWQPQNGEMPVLHILLLLLVSVGLPYFVLSTTGILFQAWFRELHPGRSPYPLYAVSNTGSLLALLSYPFVMEVWWSTDEQGSIWSFGFSLFVLLSGVIAYHLINGTTQRGAASTPEHTSAPSVQVDGMVRFLWLALPALGTMLLLAITNHLTQNVAVVPFLWVLPLALYLLSFILCFESDKWYRRSVWWGLFVLALAVIGYSLFPGVSMPLVQLLFLYNSFFFIAVMVCHGELVRLRPASTRITGFYLSVAAGGALGGLFVAAIAPILFSDFLELYVALALLYLLAPMAVFHDQQSLFHGHTAMWTRGLFILGGSLLGALLYISIAFNANRYPEITRNFFGVLRIHDQTVDSHGQLRTLVHGNTLHGTQYLDAHLRNQATAYYVADSGVGQVMNLTARAGATRRLGIIGLGAGTLASYGREGDSMRFYEINPDVIRLARERFVYLADSQAGIAVVTGDARLMLEAEADNGYDVLVLDAFSSDAIPIHLLTREAFTTYNRHLKEEGVICVHISNRHLNLYPVVEAAARAFGFSTARVKSVADTDSDVTPADWMILSRDQSLLALLDSADAEAQPNTEALPQPWTDSRSNIFTLLK